MAHMATGTVPDLLASGASTGDSVRLPALIDVSLLPGRLSLGQLAVNGFVTLLDPTCGYVTAQARTLTGRAQIVTAVIPPRTTACMRLAQWVWIGGQFPDVIELATFSHFRADMHGRPTHTYKRIMDEAHRARIGKLTLTSPIRTAVTSAVWTSMRRNRRIEGAS